MSLSRWRAQKPARPDSPNGGESEVLVRVNGRRHLLTTSDPQAVADTLASAVLRASFDSREGESIEAQLIVAPYEQGKQLNEAEWLQLARQKSVGFTLEEAGTVIDDEQLTAHYVFHKKTG